MNQDVLKTLVPVPIRELPQDVILNFPIHMQEGDSYSMRWVPGSLLHEPALKHLKQEKVYLEKQHVPYLMFYQNSSYWTTAQLKDFDQFVLDYLNALLFRIFNFKKVDAYTFISLYDFVDRFRFSWQEDITEDIRRWLSQPSSWPSAFMYRVHAAFVSLLMARKLGYTSFYDLLDFFLGAFLADIGHFAPYETADAFLNAKPQKWFFEPSHPDASLKMLEGIEDLGLSVRQMVERHHEYVDGTGFPKGVKGASAIPEHAQVVGVVTEFLYGVNFGSVEKGLEDTVRTTKNEILKNRARYSNEVFSNFIEVMNTLWP